MMWGALVMAGAATLVGCSQPLVAPHLTGASPEPRAHQLEQIEMAAEVHDLIRRLAAYVRAGAWLGRRWDEAAHAAFVRGLPAALKRHTIQVLPHGAMATMEYRPDRIRVWLDKDGRAQRIEVG